MSQIKKGGLFVNCLMLTLSCWVQPVFWGICNNQLNDIQLNDSWISVAKLNCLLQNGFKGCSNLRCTAAAATAKSLLNNWSPHLHTWNQNWHFILPFSCTFIVSKRNWVRHKFHPSRDTPATDAIYRFARVPKETTESQQPEQQRFDKMDLRKTLKQK